MPIKNRRLTIKNFKYQASHVHTKLFETIPLSYDSNLVTQSPLHFSRPCYPQHVTATDSSLAIFTRTSTCLVEGYQGQVNVQLKQFPQKLGIPDHCFSFLPCGETADNGGIVVRSSLAVEKPSTTGILDLCYVQYTNNQFWAPKKNTRLLVSLRSGRNGGQKKSFDQSEVLQIRDSGCRVSFWL